MSTSDGGGGDDGAGGEVPPPRRPASTTASRSLSAPPHSRPPLPRSVSFSPRSEVLIYEPPPGPPYVYPGSAEAKRRLVRDALNMGRILSAARDEGRTLSDDVMIHVVGIEHMLSAEHARRVVGGRRAHAARVVGVHRAGRRRAMSCADVDAAVQRTSE
ncbi:hypothetical protein ACHAWF_002599 [Thalassiosira exigua]